jgi:hypothetical protein
MSTERVWQVRSPERPPDGVWHSTINRVRGEFHEMPGMRVTAHEAESLMGLDGRLSEWVLEKLEAEGFLSRTAQGEYVRRNTFP